MKSEQIVAQHSVEQFLLPGEAAQDFRIRPGYMPELGDDQIRVALLQHPRQQREVKILDEHEGRPMARFFEHGARKYLVHLPVRLPVLGTKGRPCKCDVTKRPQALIGEAVIITLFLLRAQPDAAETEARIIRRNKHVIVPVHGFAIGITASMCYPGSFASTHDGIEGHREAARRLDTLDFSIHMAVNVGLAVGHQDELVTAQLRVNQL